MENEKWTTDNGKPARSPIARLSVVGFQFCNGLVVAWLGLPTDEGGVGGDLGNCAIQYGQCKTGQFVHCPVVGCRFSILQCLGSGSVAQTPIGDTGAILTY
jgi:hypothetical protein